ncbi:hypothetical protein Ocin01_11628 [Orchesella cincta]|uniref:Uncharacterized protein n=1 Tax=Orchesella cincta TaxID=48709 RepID=A0A1D2MPQ5_ORCCI|nr:hypothetical protein Ocin01_11628 [Orchesella cincta]
MATDTLVSNSNCSPSTVPPSNNQNQGQVNDGSIANATPPPKTRFNSARAVFEKLSSTDNGAAAPPPRTSLKPAVKACTESNAATAPNNTSSPQHKIISVRTFVNKLNNETVSGGAPPNKPHVYKKPPELVAKRLGGGTAGIVNGRELIEKQKNWTSHFKHSSENATHVVKLNGSAGKVNGNSDSSSISENQQILPKSPEPPPPQNGETFKVVLPAPTHQPPQIITEPLKTSAKDARAVTPPPPEKPPEPFVQVAVTKPPAPDPEPPLQKSLELLDTLTSTTITPSSFSSTEELTTVVDCLGSNSSLLNGSCSSLNNHEYNDIGGSGELFKESTLTREARTSSFSRKNRKSVPSREKTSALSRKIERAPPPEKIDRAPPPEKAERVLPPEKIERAPPPPEKLETPNKPDEKIENRIITDVPVTNTTRRVDESCSPPPPAVKPHASEAPRIVEPEPKCDSPCLPPLPPFPPLQATTQHKLLPATSSEFRRRGRSRRSKDSGEGAA